MALLQDYFEHLQTQALDTIQQIQQTLFHTTRRSMCSKMASETWKMIQAQMRITVSKVKIELKRRSVSDDLICSFLQNKYFRLKEMYICQKILQHVKNI